MEHLRVRFWPVAVFCSGIVFEFARSANSSRVFAPSALTFCATGPAEFSYGSCADMFGICDRLSAVLRLRGWVREQGAGTYLTVHDGVFDVLHAGVVACGVDGVGSCLVGVR